MKTPFIVALLILAFVGPSTAYQTSDYGGDDWCDTAVDPDGIGPSPTLGDSTTCDGNSANTEETSTYNGGLFTGCTIVPDPSTPGHTVCSGGFVMNADTASGSGNFDGDWPRADAVTITVSPGFTGFNVRTCYLDMVGPSAGTESCMPDVSVCFTSSTSITISIGGTQAYDPPGPVGDSTILRVTGFRISTGCGTLPGNIGTRTVRGEWSYVMGNDNSANVSLDEDTAFVGIGCLFNWSYAATAAGYYGTATGEVDIDSGLRGTQEQGQSVGQTGHSQLLPGETISVHAAAWSVGNAYAQAHTATLRCTGLGEIPEHRGCAAMATWAGAWVAPVGVCWNPLQPDIVSTCGPMVGNTMTCPAQGSCHAPYVSDTIALGLGGGTKTELRCGGITVALGNTMAAGSPLDIGTGVQGAGSWICEFTFSPSGPDALGFRAGVCLDHQFVL